ncbi:MAG: ABC transporter ATP-binding protein [Chlamydiales bacterium]|nr:ABC transporter ATP-binding protein [Chlamydiia bacterium]MCP5507885.1 ABC transporter ATP-binding protein [Chlamydiales bacterium]
MTKAIVQFDSVGFHYGEVAALRNVSFSVDPGEFIGIIGPNGGGKTTLLRLIMGFLEPDAGKITIFGKTPAKAKKDIAYVPQNLRFDRQFPISVLEMVLSGRLSRLSWLGTYSKEDYLAAEKALDRVGLSDFADRAVGSLSGGQIQRALIARALASEPKLLILDEPTANVDPEAEEHIYNILDELHKDMTIIMVTHDLRASIERVERVLLVQGTVTALKAKEVCEHFAIGLYHVPLLVEGAAGDACCQLQVQKSDGEQ